MKLQVALLPQLSLAVQVTVVVPTGKVLPLGGLHTICGVEQPPVTLGAKVTTAPAGLVACRTMLDGQVIVNCGYTVTVKLQLVELPHVSLAVQVTVVVPMGNVLPLGGLHTNVGGGLQPPLAVLVKKTTAPFELVALTVKFEEQLSTSAR